MTEPIVFLVAHPDDVACVFGGTAWLLKERHPLQVWCLTRGERGYAWSGEGMPPPSTELGIRREAEERAACALLGAEPRFLDQIDGDVVADAATCARVAEWLTAARPRAVFTLGPNEKPDHAMTHAIALKALHLAGLFWQVERYAAVRAGESYHAHADVYVDTSRAIEGKRRLCACHASQWDGAVIDGIIEGDRWHGRQAWCDHAEAFAMGLVPMAVRWQRRAGSVLWDLAPHPRS